MDTKKSIKNKYIFLDRDGTLIEDKGYVHKIKDLKLSSGTVAGLKGLQALGYKFIIITNQSGIARGLYSIADTNKFNNGLMSRLAKSGIKIEKIYLCPHHPEFTGKCLCRKPGTGLINLAIKEFSLEPSKCIFIGDKDCDIELGNNCKGITILIKNRRYLNRTKPHFKVSNLKEVVKILG